jgi:hypothetical protein
MASDARLRTLTFCRQLNIKAMMMSKRSQDWGRNSIDGIGCIFNVSVWRRRLATGRLAFDPCHYWANKVISEPISELAAKLSGRAAQIEVEIHGRFFVKGIDEVVSIKQVIGIERKFILA